MEDLPTFKPDFIFQQQHLLLQSRIGNRRAPRTSPPILAFLPPQSGPGFKDPVSVYSFKIFDTIDAAVKSFSNWRSRGLKMPLEMGCHKTPRATQRNRVHESRHQIQTAVISMLLIIGIGSHLIFCNHLCQVCYNFVSN